MDGLTYFRRWGFSINEGAGPVNVHVNWSRCGYRFFIYLYAFGKSWTYFKLARPNNDG